MLNEFQSMRLFNILFALSQMFGALAFLLVMIWMVAYEGGFSWSSEPEKQFHYHPVLMIMGFLFITGEAMVVYRILRKEPKRSTKLIHTVLHSITLLFIILSLNAVWNSHDLHRNAAGEIEALPNLYSLHSWVGLTLVILYFLQYFIGFSTFLYPGLSNTTRATIMPFHRLFGCILFLFVSMTILMGISEFAAWHHKCWTIDRYFCVEQGIGNFVGVCSLLYVTLILIMVMNPRWHRKPLPEEETLCEEEIAEY